MDDGNQPDFYWIKREGAKNSVAKELREMRLLRWMMGTKRIKRDETVEMDDGNKED